MKKSNRSSVKIVRANPAANRVIKFRVWDEFLGQFLNKCEVPNVRRDFHAQEDCSLNGLVFQQFTGLFDKNGKKIYEGDIVRCEFALQAGKLFGIVEFSEKYSHFGIKFSKNQNVPASEIAKPFSNFITNTGNLLVEKIGNIFENPSLLKQKI